MDLKYQKYIEDCQNSGLRGRKHELYSDYSLHSNGLYMPGEEPEKREKPLTAFDFFAGCGGFSLGFMYAGIQVMGGLELDFYAADTYLVNLGSYPCNIVFDNDKRKNDFNDYLEKRFKKKEQLRNIVSRHKHKDKIRTEKVIVPDICGSNFNQMKKSRKEMVNLHGVKNFFIGDVRAFTGKGILEEMAMDSIDVLCGGPPCQGFSKANRNRNVMDPRNSLVFEYARMICEMQPQTFVMEEVPEILNMTTPDGIPVIDAFSKILNDGGFAGYNSIVKTLNTFPNAKAVFKGSERRKDYNDEQRNSEKKRQ